MPAFDQTIPINVDRNVTSRAFANEPENTLRVSSVFYTLQGEGPFAGYPAVFVRLAGCNFGAKDIACQGCDTAFQLDSSARRSFSDLIREISELSLRPVRPSSLVVITGGEPLLQKNVLPFIDQLGSLGFQVQIETNGTQVSLFQELVTSRAAHVVVSPKPLVKSGYPSEPPAAWHPNRVALKFLVCSELSSRHYLIPEWADQFDTVYVSPVTVYKRAPNGEVASAWDPTLVDHAATAANYEYAAKLALIRGYRVSVQTHTFLSIA